MFAAVLVVATSLTAGAEARSAVAAPVLRGLTTLSAQRNSVVRVTLPRPVRLSVSNSAQSDAVTITGRGRVIGAALVHAGDERVVVASLAFASCGAPGCVPKAPFKQNEMVTVTGGRLMSSPEAQTKIHELPAGPYYVHLFTDGTPVSVELKLAGLSGRRAISATAPHRAVVKNGATSLPTTAGVVSSGASASVRGPLTLLANVYEHRSRPHAESVNSICYYHDSTPPAGLVLPGCPGGASGYLIHFGYATLDYQSWGYGIAVAEGESKSWYQGAYSVGAQGPTDLPTTFFWSDLRS